MKQAYFAVAVNDDGTMYLDDDISVNYDENPIWNEETEQWEDISEHEGFYDEAHLQLRRLAHDHSEQIKKRGQPMNELTKRSDALDLILEDLTDINAHTIAALLENLYRGGYDSDKMERAYKAAQLEVFGTQ
jgi:hypothetical protein